MEAERAEVNNRAMGNWEIRGVQPPMVNRLQLSPLVIRRLETDHLAECSVILGRHSSASADPHPQIHLPQTDIECPVGGKRNLRGMKRHCCLCSGLKGHRISAQGNYSVHHLGKVTVLAATTVIKRGIVLLRSRRCGQTCLL